MAGSALDAMHARALVETQNDASGQDSMQSLDLGGINGEPKHLSINELCAMKGSGILQLLATDRSGSYRDKLQETLSKGVRKLHRNALDLAGLVMTVSNILCTYLSFFYAFKFAGKVPFSRLMKRIGFDHKTLWVDSAQAGGLYGTADAFMPEKRIFIEIKGARMKAGTKNQFLMKNVRHLGTEWDVLVFVCRRKEPTDWLDANEYDRCGFWLGVVTREDYMAAVEDHGKQNLSSISFTVTPGLGAACGGKRSKSWIGDKIHWIKSSDLNSSWFDAVVASQS